jgi:hypothetical protein
MFKNAIILYAPQFLRNWGAAESRLFPPVLATMDDATAKLAPLAWLAASVVYSWPIISPNHHVALSAGPVRSESAQHSWSSAVFPMDRDSAVQYKNCASSYAYVCRQSPDNLAILNA